MSNQKAEKPTLSGLRIKTRKRDEKKKYDPTDFRDTIVQGINEAGNDLEQVSKFLDIQGSKLDYRRYAEPLFDILFAGGILAPGGSLMEDADSTKVSRAELCVFLAKDTKEDLKAYYEVFYKLTRRYKYLEKSFEEDLKKILLFLKGFTEDERTKLAKITGIFMASNFVSARPLQSLYEEHLIKEGISVEFAKQLFTIWLEEKDIGHISSTLKKSGLDGKLMDLLPVSKRTPENFEKIFSEAGLGAIVKYQKGQDNVGVKRELIQEVDEMIKNEEPVKEIITFCQEHVRKNTTAEHEAVVLVWSRIMNAVEWNKKEELVAEQALRHLKNYAPLLAALCTTGQSELSLILKVQEFCYANMNFMKVFQKIIVLFYKTDVLSEDTVLKWYKEAHSPKGKSVFLEQMKTFVTWLENAEEESDSGEEEG